jgi:hypothetical protein
MPDNSKRTGAAIEAHYRFLAWLVPTIEKFPKSQKFTIRKGWLFFAVQSDAIDVVDGARSRQRRAIG